MKYFIARIIKRVIILLCGLLLAWFTAFQFFPLVDNRLPLIMAVLATYCFIAYIALPAFVRVWQLVQRPTHVPTRSHARDGWALDPINIVIIATSERDFLWAMQKAGWVQPDPLTIRSIVKTIVWVLLRKPYQAAPFSSTYVFGKKQDLAFQIQIGGSLQHRHHVRFWRLGTTILEDDHEHHGFWRTLLGKFFTTKKSIWVGAVSLEAGINITRRTLQVTHRQEGDTDTARDFLVSSLRDVRALKDVVEIKAGEPLHTRYQGFRETIIADGYIKLCEIKRQLLAPPDTPALPGQQQKR